MVGRLYAVGGRDGSSCLRSVECFDPHTNKWSLCAPMSKRRGGVGVATCNGFLYAVGGHDAPASNPSSSRFDCVERSGRVISLFFFEKPLPFSSPPSLFNCSDLASHILNTVFIWDFSFYI